MALIDWLASKMGVRKVDSPHDVGGDARGGRAGISVETMVCSALANLACMGSDLRVEGGSARALMLDRAAEEFCRRDLVKAMTASWCPRGMAAASSARSSPRRSSPSSATWARS